jgi:branched-subunit amino acid ABC-type transport system permease component
MPTLISFLVRLLLLAAGLVMAAGVACVFVLLVALWFVRAAWCRLTGRPVSPFVMGTGPRAAFDEMMRRAQAREAGSRTPRADAAAGVRRPLADVTDVEPK